MEANRIGSSNNSCDTCIITTQSTSTSTSFCSSIHKTRLTKTTTTTAKTTITTTTKKFTNCNKIVDKLTAKGWIFLLNAKQLASFSVSAFVVCFPSQCRCFERECASWWSPAATPLPFVTSQVPILFFKEILFLAKKKAIVPIRKM
jgi:hypothetical protein